MANLAVIGTVFRFGPLGAFTSMANLAVILALGQRLAIKDLDGRPDGIELVLLVAVELDFHGMYLAGTPRQRGLAG